MARCCLLSFGVALLCSSVTVTALTLTRPELAQHSSIPKVLTELSNTEKGKQWPYWAMPPPPPQQTAWPAAAAASGWPAAAATVPTTAPQVATAPAKEKAADPADAARRHRYKGKADKNAIDFVFINVDSSVDRRNHMMEVGKELGIDLKRLSAVNVHDMAPEERVRRVPCLPNSTGHAGTRGLLLSQLKAFDEFLANSSKAWLAIFEDDARPPPSLLGDIGYVMHERPDAKVIYMDSRCHNRDLHKSVTAPGADMSFNIYSRSAVEKMRTEMDSNQENSYISTYASEDKHNKTVVKSATCLHDWFNANLLGRLKIPVATYNVVSSGSFESVINWERNHADDKVRSYDRLTDDERVRVSASDQ